MKKLLLLPLTLLALTPMAYADFPDVPATSEYHQSVSTLEDLGIVKGYPDGTFKLDQPVQRDEFLKMAYLAESKHNANRRNWTVSKLFPFGQETSVKLDPIPFPDVKATDWAAPYIAWGKEQGLIGGYLDGSFKSAQGVNFAESAKMLVETSFRPEVRTGEHWAEGYIEVLGMGMIPPSIKTADQVLTRGQVADLIYNYTLASDDALAKRSSNVMIWEDGKYLTFECLGAYESLHFMRREGLIYWRNVDTPNLYQKLEGADAASFEVLENGVSKDKNQYYYYTDPIKTALNVENLEFLTPNLAKEGNKAYYFDPSGEVKTFDYIGLVHQGFDGKLHYMTNGQKVFMLSEGSSSLNEVEGADVASFKLTPFTGNLSMALDDNTLYSGSKKIEGSSGGSFQIVGESFEMEPGGGYYATDDENVYLVSCWEGCFVGEPISNSDAASFESFNSTGYGFGKDKNQLYHLDQVLTGLDDATFESVVENLAIDKNGVYTFGDLSELKLEFLGTIYHHIQSHEYYFTDGESIYFVNQNDETPELKKLEGVDQKSFRIQPMNGEGSDNIALDDFSLFRGGQKVENSAGGDFKFIENSTFYPKDGNEMPKLYAQDSERVYLMTCYEGCSFSDPLTDSDAASFVALGEGYSKDKKNAYYLDKILVGIDAASFVYDETLKKWKDKNGTYTWEDLYKLVQG